MSREVEEVFYIYYNPILSSLKLSGSLSTLIVDPPLCCLVVDSKYPSSSLPQFVEYVCLFPLFLVNSTLSAESICLYFRRFFLRYFSEVVVNQRDMK